MKRNNIYQIDTSTNLEFNRIDNFWANALHKDVFPVPGGPCKRTMLQAYKKIQKSTNCTSCTYLWLK
jgi:hypothetical protein